MRVGSRMQIAKKGTNLFRLNCVCKKCLKCIDNFFGLCLKCLGKKFFPIVPRCGKKVQAPPVLLDTNTFIFCRKWL